MGVRFPLRPCAGVAHSVERHLAKVEVTGSSPVSRSRLLVEGGPRSLPPGSIPGQGSGGPVEGRHHDKVEAGGSIPPRSTYAGVADRSGIGLPTRVAGFDSRCPLHEKARRDQGAGPSRDGLFLLMHGSRGLVTEMEGWPRRSRRPVGIRVGAAMSLAGSSPVPSAMDHSYAGA